MKEVGKNISKATGKEEKFSSWLSPFAAFWIDTILLTDSGHQPFGGLSCCHLPTVKATIWNIHWLGYLKTYRVTSSHQTRSRFKNFLEFACFFDRGASGVEGLFGWEISVEGTNQATKYVINSMEESSSWEFSSHSASQQNFPIFMKPEFHRSQAPLPSNPMCSHSADHCTMTTCNYTQGHKSVWT
jgi:hypothetical protein